MCLMNQNEQLIQRPLNQCAAVADLNSVRKEKCCGLSGGKNDSLPIVMLNLLLHLIPPLFSLSAFRPDGEFNKSPFGRPRLDVESWREISHRVLTRPLQVDYCRQKRKRKKNTYTCYLIGLPDRFSLSRRLRDKRMV